MTLDRLGGMALGVVLAMASLSGQAWSQDCVGPPSVRPITLTVDRPTGLELADMNGDGVVDVVVGTNEFVAIHFGDDDLVGGPTVIAAGDPILVFEIIDFDADGDLDIVGKTSGIGGQYRILLNQGDGTFGVPLSFDADFSIQIEFAAADLNTDGHTDLVVTTFTGEAIVYLGQGGGAFGPPVVSSSGFFVFNLTLGDFTGDDVLDIAAIGGSSAPGVNVLPGQGDGTFGAPVASPGPTPHDDLKPADIDGDGDLDLLAVERSVDGLMALLNDGSGLFSSVVLESSAGGFNGVEIVDFNGDNFPDVVALESGSPSSSQPIVLLNDGFGGLTAVDNPDSLPVSALAVGDVNDDGHADVIGVDSGFNSIVFMFGEGDGSFAGLGGAVLQTSDDPITVSEAIDIDEDGDPDFVTRSTDNDTTRLFLNDGNGQFTPPVEYEARQGRSVWFVDLDLDGVLDMVTRNAFGNRITSRLGTAPGEFAPTSSEQVFDSTRSILAIADINGDGALDLGCSARADGVVEYAPGDGVGGFGALVAGFESEGINESARFADFDNDGDLDFAVLQAIQPVDRVVVGLNDGSGGFATSSITVASLNSSRLFAEDLDGDGVVDLVVAGNGVGLAESTRVFAGNGDGTFMLIPTGFVNEDGVDDVADVNLDGLPDLIIETSGSFVYLNNGDGTFSFAQGTAPDGARLAADFDADGDLDLIRVEVDPATGMSSLRYVENWCVFVVCAADFNDDGAADFFDVAAFLNAFAMMDPATDLNNDGLFDFFDIQSFLAVLALGCP